MVIDRIGNINRVVGPEKGANTKAKDIKSKIGGDTVSISPEAQKAQDTARASGMVKESPDIRQDRVNAVKEKMAAGAYDGPDSEILDKVAEKIAESLTRS